LPEANTVYFAEVLDTLRADEHGVNDEDLVHLAPTLRQHVNIYGKYRFDLDSGARQGGLRPLRHAPEASA
jgi:Tn3 transposase DDE domain